MQVIIGTHRRRPVFTSDSTASVVFRILRSHERTLAAVLMPDHLHWVLDCAKKAPAAVERFESLSTRCAWEQGWEGKLWQRSFFDTVIRDPSALAPTIRYVLDNPVRAGLVDSSRDYPWSHNRLEIVG